MRISPKKNNTFKRTDRQNSDNPASGNNAGNIFDSISFKKGKKPSAKRRKGKKKGTGMFSKIPKWCLWVGGILAALIYVCFFYYFFVDPYSFRWKAMYGDPVYPPGYDIHGIDISHYQEEIDWERVRNASLDNAPVRFVFIKATEGCSLIDENFNYNFYHARENYIIRSAYHFFVPGIDPVSQARFFIKQVHLEPGDLPPVLDVEKIGDLTPEQLRKDVLAWLRAAEKHYGVKPIIYTGYRFKLDYLDTPEFKDYPYWIAHYYIKKLSYKGKWHFWQHTDCGKVDGIPGNVDCNIFNGTLEELMELTIKETE